MPKSIVTLVGVLNALCVHLLVAANMDGTGSEKEQILAQWNGLVGKGLPMRLHYQAEFFEARQDRPAKLSRKVTMSLACTALGKFGRVAEEAADEKGASASYGDRMTLSNEKYIAELQKTKANAPWVLKNIKLRELDEAGKKLLPRNAFPWLRCGNVWLPDWLLDPSFVVTKTVKTEGAAGTPRLKLHFKYDPARRQSDDMLKVPEHIHSGFIEFEPESSFRITSYEYHTNSPGFESVERAEFDYQPGDGLPILKSVSVQRRDTGPKLGVVNSKELETYKIEYDATVPDEEFRLSFYGLPEPTGLTWPKSRYYMWFIGLGLAAVISGWLLLRRLRPKMTTSS